MTNKIFKTSKRSYLLKPVLAATVVASLMIACGNHPQGFQPKKQKDKNSGLMKGKGIQLTQGDQDQLARRLVAKALMGKTETEISRPDFLKRILPELAAQNVQGVKARLVKGKADSALTGEKVLTSPAASNEPSGQTVRVVISALVGPVSSTRAVEASGQLEIGKSFMNQQVDGVSVKAACYKDCKELLVLLSSTNDKAKEIKAAYMFSMDENGVGEIIGSSLGAKLKPYDQAVRTANIENFAAASTPSPLAEALSSGQTQQEQVSVQSNKKAKIIGETPTPVVTENNFKTNFEILKFIFKPSGQQQLSASEEAQFEEIAQKMNSNHVDNLLPVFALKYTSREKSKEKGSEVRFHVDYLVRDETGSLFMKRGNDEAGSKNSVFTPDEEVRKGARPGHQVIPVSGSSLNLEMNYRCYDNCKTIFIFLELVDGEAKKVDGKPALDRKSTIIGQEVYVMNFDKNQEHMELKYSSGGEPMHPLTITVVREAELNYKACFKRAQEKDKRMACEKDAGDDQEKAKKHCLTRKSAAVERIECQIAYYGYISKLFGPLLGSKYVDQTSKDSLSQKLEELFAIWRASAIEEANKGVKKKKASSPLGDSSDKESSDSDSTGDRVFGLGGVGGA